MGLSVTGRQTAGPVVISDTAKATFTVPSMTLSTYQDWQSLCVQQDAETLCDISQTLQVERENGQTVTGLRATVTKRDGFFCDGTGAAAGVGPY